MDNTPRTPGQPSPNQPPVSWAPPPPARSDRGFNFNDFLSFRYLITPGFITVIYVIGVIVITLAALAALATPGSGGAVAGLFTFIAGNLWWRIILEFVMVLFRINDSLESIDRRGRGL
jgi:Domain of unknown function (DUF4282)